MDEPRLPTEKEINRWVERMFCTPEEGVKLKNLVRQVTQGGIDYNEQLIRDFILQAVSEGILTPEQESPLVEFLLEHFLEDYI